jgi:hypothetical protein
VIDVRRVSCVAAGLLLSGVAYSAVTDEAFTRAAIVVMTFDKLAAVCQRRGGLSAGDARKVAAWQSENGVDRIRARLSELQQNPSHKQRVEQAAKEIAESISNKRLDPCVAAFSASQLPEAQFAKRSPELLAGTDKPTAPNKAAAPVAPPTPAAARDSAPALLAQIDSFGFDSRVAMGVGGFMTTDIYPVVLFRNGEALTDAAGLAFPGGIAAHKRAHPNRWTQWRRSGGKVEVTGSKGWRSLSFNVTYPSLPQGFRLDGRFQHLGGTGNVGVGGTDSVTAWRDYRFTRDGRVVRGGGAGSRAEGGNSSVVTSNIAPNRRGRYQIDGLGLNITYDDGSSERRILITDPKEPSVIWLDGVGYTQ